MSIDVSILCPTIRTHLLPAFYESAEKACKNNSFEVVFISPFEKPEYFNDKSNVKWIVDYGSPSRASQIGALQCEGTYIYNTVDDGLFVEGCIDAAVEQFKEYQPNDIINMRYRESENATKKEAFPESYWIVKTGFPFPPAGVSGDWKIALHFFMRRDYFCELGGMDCRFEYVNHGAHDLVFRAQLAGSTIYLSKVEGLICTHIPERTGDHGPIHDAQTTHDEPLFNKLWATPKRGLETVDMHQYKEFPEVWERRFPDGVTQSYKDLNYD